MAVMFCLGIRKNNPSLPAGFAELCVEQLHLYFNHPQLPVDVMKLAISLAAAFFGQG
jgi:hypothetical protein